MPTLVEGTGIHPAKPLDGFSLVNVTGTCSKGIYLANVRNAVIRDIKVTGVACPMINTHNVAGAGLAGASPIDGPNVGDEVPTSVPYQLH